MLLQVVIESGEEAMEYASLKLQPGNDAINADMAFDRKKKNIYVTTDKKVRPLQKSQAYVHLADLRITSFAAISCGCDGGFNPICAIFQRQFVGSYIPFL